MNEASGKITGTMHLATMTRADDFPRHVRKVQFLREAVLGDCAGDRRDETVRVAGAAVIATSWSSSGADLDNLAALGAQLAQAMMPDLMALLGAPALAYGKAAIIGTAGRLEHGAALLHPQLGKPVRHAIGGGKAVIPSNNKIGAAGSSIDIPLGHKDDAWSFGFIDTLTLSVSDAPLSGEMVLFLALAAGHRPFAEIGLERRKPGGSGE
jgi:hypothetical protein